MCIRDRCGMKKRKTLAKKVILCVTIGFLLTASMSTVTYADGFDENAEESEAVLRSSSKEVITDTTGEWKLSLIHIFPVHWTRRFCLRTDSLPVPVC